ncbi:MAG: TIGR03960 family B12-binding radical SAM protein [Christensenellales bacterium]
MAKLEQLLTTVEKPARYIGGEMNTDIKPRQPGTAAFAFCFPDTYEVAMSHLGMKILYYILNREPDLLCERVMMPWVDMAQHLRDERIPLFSLESRTALHDFDVVGFTLQYEMSYTNILEMLDLGGIAVKSADRQEEAPIVIAGGPCAFNPEPLAAFIDCFVIGDGETAILEVTRLIKRLRLAGSPRSEILFALSQVEGCYVPSLYESCRKADGTLLSFKPIREGVPAVVRKRVELDLDAAAFPDKIPVPYTEIVHDRIAIEIMRGCTRGCRFCQAGMLYRPVRERSLENLYSLAERLVKATGYEEMSLSSLSSGDFGQLSELIRGLMDRFASQRVAVSLPSMRIDSLVKQSLEETREVRKSGLTLAPEAGTQRLRDVINKGVTQEDLVRSVTDAFQSGWSNVKLYFMIGLPTETDEDLRGIGRTAQAVLDAWYALPKEQRASGLKITLSASTFVPKPFTPFQWAAQDSIGEIRRKQLLLREVLKLRGVFFSWHEPELSVLEACVARGDRGMGDVIYTAWQRGCRLDGWREHFKYDEWLKAFAANGIDPAFYASRERGEDELLPWAFIDAGVTQRYLWLERERAIAGLVTPDCRGGCQGCGLTRIPGACTA